MAINKNHLFEDLNGVKCAIVETNISTARAEFLKSLLEYNRYTVVMAAAPPPKTAPAPPPPAEGEPPVTAPASPTVEEKFTLGVTDVTFNTTNAIYGRLLRTREGRIVTMAYWLQKEIFSHDEIPYYDRKIS